MKSIAWTVVLAGVWLVSGSRSHAQSQAGALVGAWTLNAGQSEKPRNSAQSAPEGRRGGGDRSGRGGGGFGRGGGRGAGGRGGPGDGEEAERKRDRMRDAMRDVMDPPERLTIVESGSMVIITGDDGRTTRLETTGKKIKDDSTKVERKTIWKDRALVSEIAGLGSGKITQTFAADPERHQLTIRVEMKNSGTTQAMVIRHVYSRDAH